MSGCERQEGRKMRQKSREIEKEERGKEESGNVIIMIITWVQPNLLNTISVSWPLIIKHSNIQEMILTSPPPPSLLEVRESVNGFIATTGLRLLAFLRKSYSFEVMRLANNEHP